MSVTHSQKNRGGQHVEKQYALIVDDNPDSRKILQVAMSQINFETELVSEGNAALESVKKRIPDLILLDLMMPGMNGFQVLRHLRESRSDSLRRYHDYHCMGRETQRYTERRRIEHPFGETPGVEPQKRRPPAHLLAWNVRFCHLQSRGK